MRYFLVKNFDPTIAPQQTVSRERTIWERKGKQTEMGNQTSVSAAGDAGRNLTVSRSTGKFPLPARDAHSSCALGQRLFIFGGVVHNSPDQITEVNDLVIFDTATQSWSKAASIGDVPIPCSAAALSAVGDKLYLFGGLSHELGWLDTLHVYNTETGEWKLLEAEGSRPSPRDKLAAAVIGTNIYYFGGFGPTQEEEELTESEEEDAIPDQEGAVFGWFNDLFVYDTVNNKWSQPMQMNLGVPTPRAAHTMCAVGNRLFIFGGKDSEGRQNDLHIFNVETRKWETEGTVGGVKPEARSFHAAAAVGNKVIVTGGRNPDNNHLADLHIFDTEHSCWQQPRVTGDLPTGRGLHSCAAAGEHLVLFGGSANIDAEINQCKDIYTDTYLIKTDDILKSLTEKQNGH